MSNLQIDLGSENPDAVAFQHDPLATSQRVMSSGGEHEEERGEVFDDSAKTDHSVAEEELPMERQLEIVDMDDEDMDMLEWIVRKLIPIPKKYYWETTTTDDATTTTTDATTNLPRSVILWHNVVGSLSRAVQWLDRMGTPVANATGLTSSRFDYVLSTMTDEQKKLAAQTASERKLKRMESSSRQASAKSVVTEEEGEVDGGKLA